jgi:hypothetical protein
MSIARNKADQTISVRVSLDLLHKIEAAVARVAAARAESKASAHDQEYNEKYPATVSGLTRKALELFFEFFEDEREFVLKHAPHVVEDEVRAVLAHSVIDNKARNFLQQLADRKGDEINFG